LAYLLAFPKSPRIKKPNAHTRKRLNKLAADNLAHLLPFWRPVEKPMWRKIFHPLQVEIWGMRSREVPIWPSCSIVSGNQFSGG
jgi:hypothetical protein